ncbi:Fur family transcriptional regulator [candidate division KSB1 bacterium]
MKQSFETNIDFFFEQCRKNNLKITPQRVSIYKIIARSEQHPTAEIIYNTVKKEFPNISLDTVHRTLMTFNEIGLLNVVEGYGSPRRFDPNTQIHHHLICEQCGKIIDFTNKNFDNLQIPEELLKDFSINRKRVILSGICGKCQK